MKRITIISILLLLCILVVSLQVSANSVDENGVQAKINALKNLFPDGSYFTTTGANSCNTNIVNTNGASYCDSQSCPTCKLGNVLSKNSQAIKATQQVPKLTTIPTGRYSCLSFATFAFCYIFEHDYLENTTIVSTANSGITDEFLSLLKPGDFVKCYTSMSSSSPSHYNVFMGYDSKNVYFYESNQMSPNRVEYNNARPRNGLKIKKDAYNPWVKLVVYRSNNHTSKLTVSDNYKVTASDGFLTIRQDNSTSSTALATIPTNTIVTVTKYDKNGNWGKVTYNGTSGWINLYNVEKTSSSSYNSDSNLTTTLSNDVYLIAAPDGSLAMRSSPTTSATKLCDVPNDQYITVTKYSYDGKWDWGYVTYNGQTGWVCLYYTTKHTSHSYGVWSVIKEATCTATGSQKRICGCGAVETSTISVLGHNYSTSFVVDKVATCTTAGSKSKHCTRCSVGTEVTSIPALGHTYGTWTTVTEASCISTGLQQHTCARCGNVEHKTISALGHNYSSVWIIDKAATCNAAGTKSHHCNRCSIKTDITTIAATGHNWSDWTVTKQATYEETGIRIRKCTANGCAAQESAMVAKLSLDGHSHDFGTWVTTTEVTCEQDGVQKRICLICNTNETKEIKANGHIFGEWTIEENPTCTEHGTQKRICSICQEYEEMDLEAFGHCFGAWLTKSEENSERMLERKCDHCGETQTKIVAAISTNSPSLQDPSNGKTNHPAGKTEASTTAPSTNKTGRDFILATGIVVLSLMVVSGIAAAIFIIYRKKL